MDLSRTIRYAISGAAGLALLASTSVLAETNPKKPAAEQTPKLDKTAQQPQAKAPAADKAAQQPQAKKAPAADKAAQQPQAKAPAADKAAQQPQAKKAPAADKATQQPQAKAPEADKAAQQPQAKQIPRIKQPLQAKAAQPTEKTSKQPQQEQTPALKKAPAEKQALRAEKTPPAKQKEKLQKTASAAPATEQKSLTARPEPKKTAQSEIATGAKQAAKQQPAEETAQAKAKAPTKQETKAQPTEELAQQQAQDEQGFRVEKIVLAKDIDEGEPIDPGASFSRDDRRMFALIYVDNPNREEKTVRVSWQRKDGPTWRGFPLGIPATPKFRTVARTMTSTREPGIYKCVVSDDSGTVLDFAEFKITQ